jgi:protein SCO1/2
MSPVALRRSLAGVSFVLVVVFGIASYGLARLHRRPPLPVLGKVPEFQLTSHQGNPIRRSDLDGSVWVADFFFTSCAGPCPKMTEQMQRVQKAFAQEPDVKLVSFTVDPETDTAEILAEYAKGWGAIAGKWFFVTGEKKALYALARQGFKVTAQPGDGGPHDFIHSTRFILVDRQGNIRGYYDGTEKASVNRLIQHIRLLMSEE